MAGGEFSAEGQRMLMGLAAGLYASGLTIFAESQRIVPVDTATLKASGRVNEPEVNGDEMECVIGYGYGEELNPKTGRMARGYAIPVHERSEVFHAPPTQSHFLEQPVLEYIREYEPTLAAYIMRAEKMDDGSLRTWMEQLKAEAA